MTKEAFLTKFIDILQTDEDISFETVLESLDEWDSLSIMATASWLLDNKINITVKEISTCKTVGDIATKFGIQ